MDNLTDSDILQYEEVSKLGDIFKDAFTVGQLEEHILKPIEWRAFRDFAECDVSDVERLKMAKAIKLGIDRIRQRINEIVNSGQAAKIQLALSTRKDEDYG